MKPLKFYVCSGDCALPGVPKKRQQAISLPPSQFSTAGTDQIRQ
jgi:hypothetical protein